MARSPHFELKEEPYDRLDRRHRQAKIGLEHALLVGDEELYRGLEAAELAYRLEKVRRQRQRERGRARELEVDDE